MLDIVHKNIWQILIPWFFFHNFQHQTIFRENLLCADITLQCIAVVVFICKKKLVNDVIIAKARQPWKRQLLTTISHWNNCVSIPPAVSHDTTLKLGAPVCIWWLYGGVKSFLKDASWFSCTFDFIRVKMLYRRFSLKDIDQLFVHMLKESNYYTCSGRTLTQCAVHRTALCGTSVLLTDQKRTPQILRAKTLRVLRQT